MGEFFLPPSRLQRRLKVRPPHLLGLVALPHRCERRRLAHLLEPRPRHPPGEALLMHVAPVHYASHDGDPEQLEVVRRTLKGREAPFIW